ncbi:cupin domain-containing protein [Saccharothrix algeriensis]|uniref:Cupin domain-containing protein n=1 Tax=Saccharothrix algeriensis TaxID=173560 RepID=A0A8T8I1U3_9PSEU|nr:cupin domain-containing protein [Saccharothrix algeriensis]MBM7810246.1 putative cupin superfamily sugar epimerase [Saccharothrix algeriensis]QTR04410.1 cupin domain-containing protein [Saccharothrix algeriensis]
MTPDEAIELLGLAELPVEGGHFGQSWRSAEASAIYYLLRAPEFSGLHRLSHLELYAHHAGAPLRMLLLHPGGAVTEPVLGPDLAAGQRPQVAVEPGVWQASAPAGDWSLVGTVVVPPYTDDVVEFAKAADLVPAYPSHAGPIRRFARF